MAFDSRWVLKLTHMNFPNGFQSWSETYHEIALRLAEKQDTIQDDIDANGFTTVYSMCRDLTNRFEEKYKGREWEMDNWLETLWRFVDRSISKNYKPVILVTDDDILDANVTQRLVDKAREDHDCDPVEFARYSPTYDYTSHMAEEWLDTVGAYRFLRLNL